MVTDRPRTLQKDSWILHITIAIILIILVIKVVSKASKLSNDRLCKAPTSEIQKCFPKFMTLVLCAAYATFLNFGNIDSLIY